MHTTPTEAARQEIAAAAFGQAITAIRPKYNERVLGVQKAGEAVVIVFIAEHGVESSRGIRTLVLEPHFRGNPAKVVWTFRSQDFIATMPGAPITSGKGHNTDQVSLDHDGKPEEMKRPYCQWPVQWKGWQ